MLVSSTTLGWSCLSHDESGRISFCISYHESDYIAPLESGKSNRQGDGLFQKDEQMQKRRHIGLVLMYRSEEPSDLHRQMRLTTDHRNYSMMYDGPMMPVSEEHLQLVYFLQWKPCIEVCMCVTRAYWFCFKCLWISWFPVTPLLCARVEMSSLRLRVDVCLCVFTCVHIVLFVFLW